MKEKRANFLPIKLSVYKNEWKFNGEKTCCLNNIINDVKDREFNMEAN